MILRITILNELYLLIRWINSVRQYVLSLMICPIAAKKVILLLERQMMASFQD
ncbi:hypothetical protein IMSAGC022_00006 [Alistipes sp.]|nr:hypothetical protein IMSAGC022_00006 [Alistipes sp.]